MMHTHTNTQLKTPCSTTFHAQLTLFYGIQLFEIGHNCDSGEYLVIAKNIKLAHFNIGV